MTHSKISSPIVFEYPLLIREGHLDTFGHVNNSAYLEILEEARWDLITNRGFGLAQVVESQMGPVILEIQIRFMRELKARDKVVIKTWCTDYSGKIGMLEQVIIKSESQEQACHATFKFGLFNMKARKIVQPTPEWLNAVGIADRS